MEKTAALESLYSVVMQLQNSNTTDHAGKLTVNNPDGTELGQLTLTVSAGADPVVGIT